MCEKKISKFKDEFTTLLVIMFGKEQIFFDLQILLLRLKTLDSGNTLNVAFAYAFSRGLLIGQDTMASLVRRK